MTQDSTVNRHTLTSIFAFIAGLVAFSLCSLGLVICVVADMTGKNQLGYTLGGLALFAAGALSLVGGVLGIIGSNRPGKKGLAVTGSILSGLVFFFVFVCMMVAIAN